jgi:uncharacterized protein
MPKREETVRLCCLTREERPVADLIRFVVGPDNALWPDIDAKAEGRGVWVTASRAAVGEAVKKKAFTKSLKAQIDVAPDLADQVALRLEQRLLQSLSMARKAGQIVTGATKVKAAIEDGEILALLTATDAAPDGRAKMLGSLKGYLRAMEDDGMGQDVPHLELLSSDQLGLALGIENVIHAALTKGAAAQSALARAQRLARYSAPDWMQDATAPTGRARGHEKDEKQVYG